MALPAPIPFRILLETEKRAEIFGPEAVQKFFEEYRASMGFNGGLNSTNAFDTYLANRPQNAKAFSEIKIEGKVTFGAKLKKAEAEAGKTGDALAIKASIEEALKPSEKSEKANANFKAEIEALNDIIADTPPQFNPGAFASYLQGLKSHYTKGMETKQKADQDNLDNLFNDDAFKNNLKNALDLDDEQIENLHQEMATTLKTSQQEALNGFTSEMDKDINGLHQQAQNERNRIAFLAAMYERNKAAIDNLANANKKNKEATSIQVNMDSRGFATFEGVRIQDLATIESITGRKMEHAVVPIKDEKTGAVIKEVDQYTMQLPKFGILSFSNWRPTSYYFGRHDHALYDTTNIAAAIRACGHDSITMSVHHEGKKQSSGKKTEIDTEYAMELGRKAYEGALRAGFPPEKIVVEVNGEKKTAQQLFHGYETKLQTIEDSFKSDEKTREKYLQPGIETKTETRAMKQAVTDVRQSKTTPQPQPSSSPTPGTT